MPTSASTLDQIDMPGDTANICFTSDTTMVKEEIESTECEAHIDGDYSTICVRITHSLCPTVNYCLKSLCISAQSSDKKKRKKEGEKKSCF